MRWRSRQRVASIADDNNVVQEAWQETVEPLVRRSPEVSLDLVACVLGALWRWRQQDAGGVHDE